MESINEKLDRIIQFISTAQTACDNKHSFMEQQALKNYTLYLEKWKEKQRKIIKGLEPVHSIKEQEQDTIFDDFEDLSLVDALLEKAHAIRCKSKGSTKQNVRLSNSPSSGKVKEVRSACANSKPKICQKELLKNFHKDRFVLPRSKSTLNTRSYQIAKMTHSKSFEDSTLKKKSTLINSNTPEVKVNQSLLEIKNGTSKDSQFQLITSKQYNELKCIAQTGISPPSEQKEKKEEIHIVSNSGSPQKSDEQGPMSFPYFKSHLKSTLKSNFQIRKDGFWYPYINLQNKMYLFKCTKCSSLENFIKVIKLIYKIQEAMLWIDLLTLFEKDVLLYVKILDEANRNTIKFCHYFSSIYHESLQRIPMLNLD